MENEIPVEMLPDPVTEQNLIPYRQQQELARTLARHSVEVGDKGIMLRSMDDLIRFARLAVQSGAAPKGMTEGAAALAIQAGLERGLGPLGGLQLCVVVNGLLSWRGQGAVGLIQNSPVCKPGSPKLGCVKVGEDAATGWAEAWRVGYPAPDRREFSVLDARRAGLWGKEGPWREHPYRMLAWRAVGFLARDVFPDVLGGIPLADEALDYEPARSLPAAPKLVEAPAVRSTALDGLADALAAPESDDQAGGGE